jgi:probable HAF family extracellular repeat protein
MHRARATAAIAVIAACVASVSAQTSSFTVIPLTPGGARAHGAGISDDGSLVAIQGKLLNDPSLGGDANADFVGRFEPFSQSPTTDILADVSTGPIGLRGFAWDAGGYAPNTYIVGFDTASQRAFFYDHLLGTTALLPPLPGDPQSTPRGVNAAGTVVGRSGPSSGLGAQAVRWDGGVVQGLGLPPGADAAVDSTIAYDISTDGSTIVGVYTARVQIGTIGSIPRFDIDSFPFVYANGQYTLLPNLPGSSFEEGVAYAVSGDGSVVVGRSHVGTGREAFMWTAATGTVGLGYLPTAQALNSQAEDVSDDGRIIVGWSQSDAPGARSAFVWDELNGMRELGAELTRLGHDLQGVVLVAAESVSADGTVITGYGEDALGNPLGFVAVLPRTDRVVEEFGSAAPWTGGTPRITADPRLEIGVASDLVFYDNPPNAGLVALLGLVELPTPFDLAALVNFPAGAALYFDPLVTAPLATDALGESRVPFGTIPNDPVLSGVAILAQSLAPDPGLPPGRLPIAVSRGTRLFIR